MAAPTCSADAGGARASRQQPQARLPGQVDPAFWRTTPPSRIPTCSCPASRAEGLPVCRWETIAAEHQCNHRRQRRRRDRSLMGSCCRPNRRLARRWRRRSNGLLSCNASERATASQQGSSRWARWAATSTPRRNHGDTAQHLLAFSSPRHRDATRPDDARLSCRHDLLQRRASISATPGTHRGTLRAPGRATRPARCCTWAAATTST